MTASVLRIVLCLLAWQQFAAALRPVHHLDDPLRLGGGAAFYVASALMCAGLWSRWSTLATGLLCLWQWVYIEHVLRIVVRPEPVTDLYVPMLGVAITVLAATPCGASFSVDRWRGVVSRGVDVAVLRPVLTLGTLAVVPSLGAWGVVAALVPLGLYVPRIRTPALVATWLLYGLSYPILELGVGPMTVCALALAFVDPLVDRTVHELQGTVRA